MAPQYIFTMKDLRKVTPQGKEILKGIWLSFYPTAKIGVLGGNGAGKSTLLRIMAGRGQGLRGRGLRRRRNPHRLPAPGAAARPKKTVLEIVEEAVAPQRAILQKYEELSANWSDENADELGRLQDQIDAQNLWELDRHVEMAMDALRLPPGDADVSTLSGGERRRVALCRLLLQPNDMLLLDEPTNHLDAESVAWLEQFLKEFKGCVVAVTHDRYFLDNVAGWILELDRGAGIPWEGNYSSWLDQKQTRLAQEEKEESARRRTLQRELEWVRMSPRARQAKGKARLAALRGAAGRGAAAGEARGRARDLDPARAAPGRPRHRGQELRKAYGDKLLMDDVNFILPRGGIVGVIGPNGAGKTTLFRMIVGQEKPDAGALKIGETVALSYVDQSRDSLKGDAHGLGGDLRRRQGPRDGRQEGGQLARLRERPSASAAPTSRRRSRTSPAASATASTWPRCSRAAATCCCSTSPPTTSTWTRCARWKRRW